MSYDARKRGTAMESSLTAASEALKQTISELKVVVPQAAMNEPITLQAITPYPQTVQTSFGREVRSCIKSGVYTHHASSNIAVVLCLARNSSLGNGV
jgi:hypothetical protein